jgi:hypothetical protein
MLKDARYAQELAKEKSLATPVLDAGTAAMETLEQAGRGEADYSVVFENFTPRKKPFLDADDDTPTPRKKTRITLKASKFQLADDEEETGGAAAANA